MKTPPQTGNYRKSRARKERCRLHRTEEKHDGQARFRSQDVQRFFAAVQC